MEHRMDEVSAAWDREYRNERYLGEPPVPFVRDIVAVASREGLLGGTGLYIGCGNGRNYLPLVGAGLDLIGLDVSLEALREVAKQAPERADQLIHGDLSDLRAESRYPVVVGIQVFQHGSRAVCHEHVRAAQRRVIPGGILAIRVNATETHVEFQHEVVETQDGPGFTIRYVEGPKRGLLVHFFEKGELEDLLNAEFEAALTLRLDTTLRRPPRVGQWSQWEGIWRRPTQVHSP